jgi:hypothetical protein
VEDALGFKFPVPSEYDYKLLNVIIQHRFRNGPGAAEVKAGNYELFSAKNSKDIFSENTRILPGSSITMAILLFQRESEVHTDEICPMPRCSSNKITSAPGGGRSWYVLTSLQTWCE